MLVNSKWRQLTALIILLFQLLQQAKAKLTDVMIVQGSQLTVKYQYLVNFLRFAVVKIVAHYCENCLFGSLENLPIERLDAAYAA